jgi:rhodanese-related sulfurtransferase
MLAAALAAALLALAVALVALAKSAAAKARLDAIERDARRRADEAAEAAQREVETTRQLLAVLAAGGTLTRDQVLEGRLWSEVAPADGLGIVQGGDVRIVDVRTPEETAGGIIPGAVLIPIDALEARMNELPRDGKRTLVYCAGGARSAAACELLSSKGYTNLFNLAGGFSSWPGLRAKP